MILCALIWGGDIGCECAFIDHRYIKDVNDNNRGQCVHLTLYALFRIADRIHFLNHIEFHENRFYCIDRKYFTRQATTLDPYFNLYFPFYLIYGTISNHNQNQFQIDLSESKLFAYFFFHVRFELFIDIFRLVSKENSGFS